MKALNLVIATIVILSSVVILAEGSSATPVDGTEYEAELNGQYFNELQDAIDAAEDGDTVKVLRDIVYDKTEGLIIKSGITLDGLKSDGTICQISTSTASRLMKTYDVDGVHVTSPVTIRNLDLLNTSEASSRCLDTRSLESSLTIENVTMTVDNQAKENQVFNIGGNVNSTLRITVDDSRFITNGIGYCFISFNTIDMTVTDSYFEGWCAIYLKGIMKGDHGTSNSVVDVRDSTIRSFNDAGYDPDIPDNNSFGAIVLEDKDISVTLTDVDVEVSVDSLNDQYLFSVNEIEENGILVSGPLTGNELSFGGDRTVVRFTGDTAAMYKTDNEDNTFEVTGGSYNIDVSEYLSDSLHQNPDGSISDNSLNIPPNWDDDDEYVPPIIPAQPEDSGDDDAVTIVACAAAAVVAALMVAYLIIDRRQ